MPVHHRLRFLTFPMRTSRLCSLWPDMRSLRFRRVPFGRDVTFDPGGATASRVAIPHILPSTVGDGGCEAYTVIGWGGGLGTPLSRPCVRHVQHRFAFSLAPALRSTASAAGRPALVPAARYYLTGAGFSPAGTRQLRLTH